MEIFADFCSCCLWLPFVSHPSFSRARYEVNDNEQSRGKKTLSFYIEKLLLVNWFVVCCWVIQVKHFLLLLLSLAYMELWLMYLYLSLSFSVCDYALVWVGYSCSTVVPFHTPYTFIVRCWAWDVRIHSTMGTQYTQPVQIGFCLVRLL